MRVYKETYNTPLPEGAKVYSKQVRRRERWFTEIKQGRKFIEVPLSGDKAKYLSHTAKWYIRFNDRTGIRRKLSAFTSKQQSDILGQKIENLVACKIAGQTPPPELQQWLETLPSGILKKLVKWGLLDSQREAANKTITEHIEDYRASLKVKGRSKKYIGTCVPRVERVLSGCRFLYLSNIDPIKVELFIDKITKPEYYNRINDSGKNVREVRQVAISKQSRQHYTRACKQFSKWLVDNGRTINNPLTVLKCQCVSRAEVVHKRRALGVEDVRKLLCAAGGSEAWRNISGVERALIYRFAIESGLRANELRQLTKSDFDFENKTVTVQDHVTKNRQEATLPLMPQTCEQIKKHLAMVMPNARAFKIPDKTSKMMQHDLELAGIPYETEEGVVDFHATRHTFGTMLAANGVHPKTAQMLMRHSKIDLTMSIYTHSVRENETKAVESLPDFGILPKDQQKATGTEGKPLPNAIFNNSSKSYHNLPESHLVPHLDFWGVKTTNNDNQLENSKTRVKEFLIAGNGVNGSKRVVLGAFSGRIKNAAAGT